MDSSSDGNLKLGRQKEMETSHGPIRSLGCIVMIHIIFFVGKSKNFNVILKEFFSTKYFD